MRGSPPPRARGRRSPRARPRRRANHPSGDCRAVEAGGPSRSRRAGGQGSLRGSTGPPPAPGPRGALVVALHLGAEELDASRHEGEGLPPRASLAVGEARARPMVALVDEPPEVVGRGAELVPREGD